MEQAHYASSTINLRLAAVPRLAYEAPDAGLLSPDLAAGIRRVKGAKKQSCTFYVCDPLWPGEFRLLAMPGVMMPEPMHGFVSAPETWEVIARGDSDFCHDATNTRRYWIAQGDLSQAKNAVGRLLDLANRTLKNKHIALGHMLRAEIAVLEDKPEVAQVDYDEALGLVDRYPCPTIDWRIAKDLARNCQRLHKSERASELLARARAVTQHLAESIVDPRLRNTFLSSEAVRTLR